MCVAIPGIILEISTGAGIERTGLVTIGGIPRPINLALVPEAEVGDAVITHSGFAIRLVPHDLLEISPPG